MAKHRSSFNRKNDTWKAVSASFCVFALVHYRLCTCVCMCFLVALLHFVRCARTLIVRYHAILSLQRTGNSCLLACAERLGHRHPCTRRPEGHDFDQRFPTPWPTFLKDYCKAELGVEYFEFTGPFAGIDTRKSWEVTCLGQDKQRRRPGSPPLQLLLRTRMTTLQWGK